MNSPTKEQAVTINGTPDGIAGLSDVFILGNFASIRSSEGSPEVLNVVMLLRPCK